MTGPVFNVDQRGKGRRATTRGVCDIGAYDTGGTTGSQAAPSITSPASATAHQSKPFAFTVTTTGSPKPALTESGALPSGVFFTNNNNGNGTASFAGTPAAGSTGTYPITITATDGVAADASQSFTLTVGSS